MKRWWIKRLENILIENLPCIRIREGNFPLKFDENLWLLFICCLLSPKKTTLVLLYCLNGSYISDSINFNGYKLCSCLSATFVFVVLPFCDVNSLWHSKELLRLSFNGTFISHFSSFSLLIAVLFGTNRVLWLWLFHFMAINNRVIFLTL